MHGDCACSKIGKNGEGRGAKGEGRGAKGDLGRAKPRPGRRIPNGLDTLLPVTSKPTISIVGVLMFLVLSFGILTLLASPLAPLQRRGESLLVNAMRIFVKFFILVSAEFSLISHSPLATRHSPLATRH